MKAVLCKQFGPPSQLVVEEAPSPEPGPTQVRIDVNAAGVNFPDLLMVQGLYQFKPPFPFSPGNEVAGVVSAVGERVEGFAVGDRVFATVPWGGFAEQVVAEALVTLKIPNGMEDDEAAAFLLTYATSKHALEDRAQLKAGETLLVLGAAGGVGIAAIQIGKAMGARVIAAASTEAKRAACVEAGADATIDYTSEDLKKRTKELTDGNGADVIYDPVGGPFAEPALRAIAWEGRYLVVGFAAGDIPKLPFNLVLLKGCQVVGVFWGSFAAREIERNTKHLEELIAWRNEGKIRPVVSKAYALADAHQALEALERREVIGKVVVRP
ncbi:MAG: NADPH:quinone oxidoreductase family protein [Deltaproteobacteria bacterium]|jgi:NADPH2:quinone reductase